MRFASKVFEKVLVLQLKRFLDKHTVFDEHQSAYKKYHSSETALLDLTSNFLWGLNNKSTFLVISLDLSAAFDTVDHGILLSILLQIGIIGQALSLIKPYLNGRTQCVLIDGSYSEDKSIETGVSQGSILGPVLFILYLLPLRSLLNEYLASYHIYADDITIYLEFDQGTTFAIFLKHKKIIASVLKLLAALKVKVNSSKTHCMFVTNQRTRLAETITIDGIGIEIKDSVKVLGVTLDYQLGFSSFINNTCAKSYYHLRRITSIRKYLSFDLTKLLILTFVITRLDYCNSLLYGAPDYMIKKLQRVQNRAACLLLHQKILKVTYF